VFAFDRAFCFFLLQLPLFRVGDGGFASWCVSARFKYSFVGAVAVSVSSPWNFCCYAQPKLAVKNTMEAISSRMIESGLNLADLDMLQQWQRYPFS